MEITIGIIYALVVQLVETMDLGSMRCGFESCQEHHIKERDMLECLIVGDSIAVGIKMHRPECASYAQVGITSTKWNIRYSRSFDAKVAIISLGSNDHSAKLTMRELLEVRRKIKADRVYWIIPAIKPEMQQVVREIARMHNDARILIPYLSKDKVHPTPTGYKELARQTKPM